MITPTTHPITTPKIRFKFGPPSLEGGDGETLGEGDGETLREGDGDALGEGGEDGDLEGDPSELQSGIPQSR